MHHIRNPMNLIKTWLAFFGKPFVRFILLVLTCLVLAGAGIVLLYTEPSQNLLIPSCSFYRITHLYCPGCGMTRALYAVSQGQIGKAFSHNILWPFILLFILGSLAMWFFYLLTGKNPFDRVNRFLQLSPALTCIFVILFFAFWILRNIPVQPFIYLSP